MSLVFVDCEAVGGCPATGRLTEFGAVAGATRRWFRGTLVTRVPTVGIVAHLSDVEYRDRRAAVFTEFAAWLAENSHGRPVMVSDNPAYDFQWINDGFWQVLGYNPLGHSARRISDFYAGLVGDFRRTQEWKRLRVTPHDHDPVHDALGNLEAFERLLRGER